MLPSYALRIKFPLESNSTNWAAKLSLRFESRDGRTVMSERRHSGPLQVQKPLYPEGDSVCHAVIIHPPGGMAEGDSLEIHVVQEAGAKTVLCNPAASKWYKSRDRFARQNVTIQLGRGAQLDWLPQENIIFDSTRVDMCFRLELADDASAAGWEMVVLGRRAMGETWDSGEFRCANQLLDLDGELLWAEKTNFTASSGIRFARQGLVSFPIFGTFWAVGSKCTSQVVEDMASRLPFTDTLRAGVTCLPRGVIVLRALAQKIEPLRDLMIECWSALRPVVHGRSANRLRLWAT